MGERRSRRWCAALLLLLTVALLSMIYKFIIAGNTVTGTDDRTAVVLKPAERYFVLAEMRQFLSGTQQIVSAANRNDFKTVAAAARSIGRKAIGTVPTSLMGKLPLGFKRLGLSVHSDFDQLAMDAEAMGDRRHTLHQLGDIMNKCVACHSTYQLQSAAPK